MRGVEQSRDNFACFFYFEKCFINTLAGLKKLSNSRAGSTIWTNVIKMIFRHIFVTRDLGGNQPVELPTRVYKSNTEWAEL